MTGGKDRNRTDTGAFSVRSAPPNYTTSPKARTEGFEPSISAVTGRRPLLAGPRSDDRLAPTRTESCGFGIHRVDHSHYEPMARVPGIEPGLTEVQSLALFR